MIFSGETVALVVATALLAQYAVLSRKRRREDEDSLLPAEMGWPNVLDPSVLTTAASAAPPGGECKLSFHEPDDGCGDWVFCRRRAALMLRPILYSKLWNVLEDVRGHVNVDDPGKEKDRRGLLIRGHPGIGKTHSLDVLLCMSLSKYPKVPVLVISAAKLSLFIAVGEEQRRYECCRKFDPSPSPVVNLLKQLGYPARGELLVLHDVKTTGAMDGAVYHSGFIITLADVYDTTVVVASSPKRDNYKIFTKDMKDSQHYKYKEVDLPTLTKTESFGFLKKCCNVTDENKCEEIFFQVGGVPRHFVGLEDAIAVQDLGIRSVNFDPSVAGTDDMTNAVVQRVPLAYSPFFVYDFVSRRARQEWVKQWSKNTPERVAELLKQIGSELQGVPRDVLGRLFETYVLSLLKSGKFKDHRYTLLSKKALNTQTTTYKRWAVPQPLDVHTVIGNDAASILPVTEPTLYVPMNSNFPVVNFVLTEKKKNKAGAKTNCTLIQVTVGATHQPPRDAAHKLLTQLEKNGLEAKELVWVVDSGSTLNQIQGLKDSNKDAKLDLYDKIPQHLCVMNTS